MKKKSIHVIGAGPASLTAAIHLARNDYPVTVYEMKSDVGKRFNGDFQGLANWTDEEDVRDFLVRIGIRMNFEMVPSSNGDFFNSSGERYNLSTSRPLFYMVERGTGEGSLDQGLKRQALQTGVKFQFNKKIARVPEGSAIVGTGPRKADAVARGIVFETTHEDYYAAFLNNEIAPKGYAYLLVHDGRATFATCIFENFKKAFEWYRASYKEMMNLINIEVENADYFGGYVNFSIGHPLMKKNRFYYVGESAGFQDALFGFGLKYAVHSGYLAARSIIHDLSYSELCREHILPGVETSIVNRGFYNRLNNSGYTAILDRLKNKDNIIPLLIDQYKPSRYKRYLLPVIKKWISRPPEDESCSHSGCSCIWCTHGEHTLAESNC